MKYRTIIKKLIDEKLIAPLTFNDCVSRVSLSRISIQHAMFLALLKSFWVSNIRL